MRLFGQPERRFALDPAAAKRIFQKELQRALDQIEEEREQASMPGYEFDDFPTFVDVHTRIYRYLSETNCAGGAVTVEALVARFPEIPTRVAQLALAQLHAIDRIWYQARDETAEAMEEEGLETDIFHLDHAMRLRFEGRLAALSEFEKGLADPVYRFGLPTQETAVPVAVPMAVAKTPTESKTVSPFEGLSATQFAQKYIEENPKLVDAASGKRSAKWTDKTRTQFEAALRMLEKSIGKKDFVRITNDDLKTLLGHFDRLPHSHHKSPRHHEMSLEEICLEAEAEIERGHRDETSTGLNVPTLNRHFRFIRMAHEWARQRDTGIRELDWSAYSFEDGRTAREQREAFPVELGRKVFRLPPWRGCASRRQRFKPGQELIHDSAYWVFPILWYSGMRREEACKLMTADVKLHECGIWYFDIDNTVAGRVKSASSRRCIPLAAELVRLGLPEFVAAKKQAGEALLFGELVYPSRRMGDTYYRLCWSKLGRMLGDQCKGVTLHGIRHMVADELKAADINVELRADLLGHTMDGETMARYSKASRLRSLQPAVDAIPIVTATVQPSPVTL